MVPPFVWVAVAWLVGLWLGETVGVATWQWASLMGVTLMILLGYLARGVQSRPITHNGTLIALVMLIFALGGAYRSADTLASRGTLATYNQAGIVTLIGTIDRYPEQRATYTTYVVAADVLSLNDAPPTAVRGTFLVNLPPYPAYTYGDQLRLSGELQTPSTSGDFNYRDYLAIQGIHSIFRADAVELIAQGQGAPFIQTLSAIRSHAATTIRAVLPEPHASLLNGIVLGLNGAIPDTVQQAFNATGTTHVLVISGANFSVLVATLTYAGRKLFRRYWNHWWVLASIVLYALLVGGDPPVIRAAVMGGIAVYATLTRRLSDGLNSLAIAIVFFTALAPAQRADVGFQLSALATFGLIVGIPWFRRITEKAVGRLTATPSWRGRIVQTLTDVVGMTLAAQIVTTPLILSTFGRLSLVSLFTNVLIAPVQALTLQSGIAALLLGMLWTPLGQIAAVVPYWALTWTLAIVEQSALIPYASVAITEITSLQVWGLYGAAGVIGWWLTLPKTVPIVSPFVMPSLFGLTRRTALRVGAGVVALVIMLVAVSARPDGNLHLYMLDVGQGDALLIVTPDGKQILVDGAPESVSLLQGVGDVMPFWDRTLDLVVLTHPDQDHLGGLPDLLARYEVAQILTSGDSAESDAYGAWQAAVVAEGVTPTMAQAGLTVQAEEGVVLEVLAPPPTPYDSPNQNSVVLRLRYGSFCALLTGDIEREREASLVAENLINPCQVLKVAHHGSNTSTTAAFLEAAAPQYALISAGSDNRFGHPAPEVLAALAARNVRVFRTDTQGTVHLWTNGISLWAESRR